MSLSCAEHFYTEILGRRMLAKLDEECSHPISWTISCKLGSSPRLPLKLHR